MFDFIFISGTQENQDRINTSMSQHFPGTQHGHYKTYDHTLTITTKDNLLNNRGVVEYDVGKSMQWLEVVTVTLHLYSELSVTTKLRWLVILIS